MTESPLETYLASVDARWAAGVRALHAAIVEADTQLVPRISYRMLMYAREPRIGRDWVCAIDARPKVLCLRFLHGVLLDDPAGLLRSGTSTLKTIDYQASDAVDPHLVIAYVREAVERHPD